MLNRRENNEVLNKALLKIEGTSTNESFKYIVDRINDKSYQGHTSVNHNRITVNKIEAFIETLPRDGFIEIPKGDAGKGKFDINDYKQFDDLVKNFNKKTGQGTQNTIRKNSSPDFARYGFIQRYLDLGNGKVLFPENGEKINTSGKRLFWKISNLGIRFLKSDLAGKQEILQDEANRLHEKIITVTYEILKEFETLSIFEFMMFVNKPQELALDEDIEYSIKLIKSFRSVGKIERESIDNFLSKVLMSDQLKINKKFKFDYGNWKNDTQQLIDTFKKLFIFKISTNGFNAVEDRNGKPIRNKAIYGDYNRMHHIEKRLGYEYHHIVPIAKAKNEEQLRLIDNENNLIYLDAGVHAIFSQKGNPYIVFSTYTPDYIELSSLYDEVFRVQNTKYRYDLLVIPKLMQHNKIILRSLGYDRF